MADDDGGGTIAILVVFVCCIVSCAIGLLIWANGGTLPGGFDISAVRDALKKLVFTRAEQQNISQLIDVTGSFGYENILRATTVAGVDLGSLVTDKTQYQCDTLCHETSGCVGYTIDGTNCQLKNNVTTIQFKPNTSNLYASRDIGGVLYEHFPYTRIEDGMIPASMIWTFSGSFIDAVANCKTNETCGGFTWDGNSTAVMYPQIYAVDSTKPTTGQAGVYTTLEKEPIFVSVPGRTYTDTPTKTFQTVPQWALPQPFNPAAGAAGDAEHFTNASATNWPGSGWDAGPDGFAQRYDGPGYSPGSHALSNTINVNDLAGCMNACVKNTWCQSFVYDSSAKSCYMRRDQAAWPARKLDRPTQQICVPGGYQPVGLPPPAPVMCDCGVVGSSGGLGGSCNTNTIEPKSGVANPNKSSYVRRNPPLPLYCPQQCKNNVDCVVGWYDTSAGNCNTYEFTPTQAVSGSASTQATTWMLENFPGP